MKRRLLIILAAIAAVVVATKIIGNRFQESSQPEELQTQGGTTQSTHSPAEQTPVETTPEPSLYSVASEASVSPAIPPEWQAGAREAALAPNGQNAEKSSSK